MIDRAWGWLTGSKHSLYGLAVTRMILGFIIATELMVNFTDRHYTWGDGAAWTSGIRAGRGWPSILQVMFGDSGGAVFTAVYLATIVVGLLMMVGFYSRASTLLALFMFMSLSVVNPFVGSGGDSVLRITLFYLLFLDSGRHWSVDSWLRNRRGNLADLFPAWLTATLHNLGLILIIHQVVMIYVTSALWKVQSAKWLDGSAVYYSLQVKAYSPWLDHIHLLTDHSWIVAMASYTAIGVQLFVPVLLMYRPTRFLSLIALTGIHLGIGLLMGLLYFSLVMIAVDILLISDRSWFRLETQIRKIWIRWWPERGRKLTITDHD